MRTAITNLVAGDSLVIGNDSVGYQTIKVSSITETALDSLGVETATPGDITAYEFEIVLESRYTLAETSLYSLSLTKKWAYASLFGKAPEVGTYHIAVIDSTGNISGEAGQVVEIYEGLSITQGSTLTDGRNNYYADVINNNSSWVNVANTANPDST